MRVLDIDLDLFLADCCPLAEKGERPELAGHEPWPEAEVVRFLEEQCGLDREHPVPGRIYETHDGSLRFWAERLADGTLTAPFAVTHLDTHSDLGIGYPGPGFVLYNVLAMRPERRTDIASYDLQHKLDEANYLLFALAFRWISELDNVRNPRSRPDIPQDVYDPGHPGCIRLHSLTASLFEKQNGPEPVIPFRVYEDYRTFRAAGPYDYVTLAMSPRYAPKEADRLAEVIRPYIRLM